MLIQAVADLKDNISIKFAEDIVYLFCFKNRMMLPHKNGSAGLSTLKIIEVLRRLRNKENIYELLESEY